MSKNDPSYEYIESPFILSRREFIAIGGIIVALWPCRPSGSGPP
jgi:hypothetical protein